LVQAGARGGAVAPPELVAVHAVVGGEEQRVARGGQVVGIGAVRRAVGAAAGTDVLDQDGAASGAVAPPELAAVGPVVGRKEKSITDRGQFAGIGALRISVRGARGDVLDQDGAGGGAVALPQLHAVGSVVGGEEQRPGHAR